MTLPASPRVAVIIATIHRPDDIVIAIESVLRSRYGDYEVVVVDQTDDGSTRERLRELMEDPKVQYVSHDRRGLSAALNRGARATTAGVLAITGDDCTVAENWLEEMVAAFEEHPGVGVLFGSVHPGPCDEVEGFVPGCRLSAPALIERLTEIDRLSGTTANMGIRRSVWEELGGFDEALGVGAPLLSGEDLDFTLRALFRGHQVLQDPRIETTHRSSTSWGARSATILRNWHGSGAALAKSVKTAPGPTLRALLRLSRRWVNGGSDVAATYGPQPDRVSMLRGFAVGLAAGFRRPVDPSTGHFQNSEPVDPPPATI